jgi:transcriptional antiterminator RfaH
MEAWYALYTKPNAEAQVARALEMRGFNFFLPLLPPRKSNARPQPLFPSYLFVRCDLSEVTVDEFQFLPGLRRIVEFSGRPAVVAQDAIDFMARELDEIDAAGGLVKHQFRPGDTVVIDSGPLSGLRGVFQGPLGPAERVRILVRFLGETNRAEVPLEAIRKAGADDALPRRRRGTRGRGRRINHGEP